MRTFKLALVLITALFLLAPEATAQDETGYLGIASRPQRAWIYLDGNYTNSTTPTSQLLGLRPGRYRLELAKPGYKLFQADIIIEAGKVLQISAALAKTDSEEPSRLLSKRYVEAYITVISAPSGANVYLDDEFIGKTPIRDLEIQVKEPGDRRLRIVKSGYKPHEQTVEWAHIRDSVKVHVSANLEQAEEAVEAKPPPAGTRSRDQAPESGKPRRGSKFAINNKVIALSIVLVVVIALLTARIVVRHRRRVVDD